MSSTVTVAVSPTSRASATRTDRLTGSTYPAREDRRRPRAAPDPGPHPQPRRSPPVAAARAAFLAASSGRGWPVASPAPAGYADLPMPSARAGLEPVAALFRLTLACPGDFCEYLEPVRRSELPSGPSSS